MVGTPCDTPVTPHRPWLGLHQPRGAHLRRVLQRAPQPGPPHLHRQAPAPQPLARHPAPGGCRPRGDMVGGGTHMYTTGTPHPPAPTGLCLSSADGSHLGEQRGQLHLGALAAGSGPSAERAPEGKPPGQSAVSAPPPRLGEGRGGFALAGRSSPRSPHNLLSPPTPPSAPPSRSSSAPSTRCWPSSTSCPAGMTTVSLPRTSARWGGGGCRDTPLVVGTDSTPPHTFNRFPPPQQLHSSVRTGNLETCLRLLSLGAQANFFHPVSVWWGSGSLGTGAGFGGGGEGGSWSPILRAGCGAEAARTRRRKGPRRCTWPPRPGRSCRQSCWWSTEPTPGHPT